MGFHAPRIVILFFAFAMSYSATAIFVRFTNAECETYDETFCTFRHCHLKVIGRNRVALNVHVNLLQLPVDNITVNAQLFRKSYDYRPYLYNMTTDACAFLKNGYKYLYWKMLMDISRPYTNVNHTCPYNHDIIIKNFVLEENMMQHLPFPSGNYMVRFLAYASNDLKVKSQIHIVIQE